ncbi:SDR family oxidoreductase [Paenibacillus soyae]|uniref:SDR family oxidoreductase n=1 Tax=Paenibacillus soyae TaxID=2969249 RepID=A0A9X2MKM7_9BACL|nr:SDR family oxidoreductase [Paenibacillus soyae]MCR2802406.1 SDR family oxidoreductase [Paenibacillus soyae]
MELLITGAGRGLGYELTAEAVKRGHRVWAGVRDTSKVPEKLAALLKQFPEKVIPLLLDVTDEHSIEEASAFVREKTGALDAVINNAAILLGRGEKLEELDMRQVEQSVRTNLYGPMMVMKHFLPLLRKGSQQAVLNISSESGSMARAYAGDYSYALTKAALNMFTAQLRSDLAKTGCVVYAVHPGWIRTDMGGQQATGDAAEAARSIMDLTERKLTPPGGAWFIDRIGNPMEL